MTEETDGWDASALSVREALREAIDAGSDHRAAVATITGVEGSAYRRPGAKRVVAPDSPDDSDPRDDPVAALAERALADGPVRETIDLTTTDGPVASGLGYNGVVEVLVEPADRSVRPALERVESGERVALLTVVGDDRPGGGDHPDAEIGSRAVVGEDGDVHPGDPRPTLPDDLLAEVRERASEFAAAGRSEVVRVETERGEIRVFVDGLEPVPELLIFGADGDVRPVARLARDAGFRVTVACPPGAQADSEKFPAAHEVVGVEPSEIAEVVSRPPDTYAVLMSHDFAADRGALASLLATDVAYVGLLGPRKRFESMYVDLAESGVELSGDADRIAAPVGLDLGGGEPTRIALSIVAEALAVSNGRDGGRLTDAEGPIHPRADDF